MNNIELVVGQTVLVELEGECVVGELTHVSAARTFIRLSNTRDVATNKQQGSQDYFSSEVRNIQILDGASQPTNSRLAGSAGSGDDSTVQADTKPIRGIGQLSSDCLNNALAQVHKCVFVHQTDSKYHDVITFLKKQRHLGIALECVEEGRHSKSPSLLSIGTLGWIFIFDIKWIKITKDMGDLLCSDRHRRVIHNGRLMRDALQHLFGVAMGKCFDTMVAHIAISKKEQNEPVVEPDISIQTCVEHYLRLPESFFNLDANFDERPLTDEIKREAAKKVAFLLPLQDHFIHEIMLQPFYGSCEAYAGSLAQTSDFVDSLAAMRANQDEITRITVQPFSLGVDMMEDLKLTETSNQPDGNE